MATDGPADQRSAAADRDGRLLALLMHLVFLLLLSSALVRYLQRHNDSPNVTATVLLSVLLAVIYLLGVAIGGPVPGERPASPDRAQLPRLLWLCAMVAVWAALVALAPSFALCAVPVLYTALRILPPVAAYLLVGVFTVLVVVAQLRLADRFDLDLVIAPPAIAALATAAIVYLDRQAARQRALIDELVGTRRELAATERREGTLAERQRLAMEIHDTLAQGLSSQQMLLQAADRLFASDPGTAREHLRTAERVTEHSLTEARRFVHDLAPADLAAGGSLEAALQRLADRESSEELTVSCRVDGAAGPDPLPDRMSSAVVRIVQGALANVREHSGADRAAISLTYLADQVRVDVVDNGRGFDPDGPALPAGPAVPVGSTSTRGHGLPAIRARVHQLGGTLTLESSPGDGTVVSAAFPLPVPSAEGDRR